MDIELSKPELGRASARDERPLRVALLIYPIVFLSAFLLFEVELVIAKYLLPWFGGTPAVFTTCMLVFQLLLLLGYAYAYLLESYLSPGQQMFAHIVVIAAALAQCIGQTLAWHIPLLADATLRPHDSYHPVLRITLILTVSVALPFFVLSTTGPLLQAWWARIHTSSPYKLYAVSNVGSLLGLLTYPVVFEPHTSLKTQAALWAVGFLLFGCGAIVMAWMVGQSPIHLRSITAISNSVPSWRRIFIWLLLGCCGSLLFLATTNQICQEVAVVPFLWVLPLSLYLASFIICFSTRHPLSRSRWTAVLAVATILVSLVLYDRQLALVMQIAIYSFALFAGCMVCHSELVRFKPPAEHLTSFYLSLATGAAIGGVCVALIFPVVFKGFWEFHLGLWICWTLLCGIALTERSSWIYQPKAWLLSFCALLVFAGPFGIALKESKMALIIGGIAVSVLIGFLLTGKPAQSAATQIKAARFSVAFTLVILAATLLFPAVGYLNGAVLVSRNFYGVLSVVKSMNVSSSALFLRHGRTLHGFQYVDAAQRDLPTGYYGPSSGVGLVLRDRIVRYPAIPLRIGVVGLGVGTLAAYGRTGDSFRFYEINPDIIRMAGPGQDRLFTYVRDCRGKVDVVLGDARISLERELSDKKSGDFDVLVIDAFSGDNIPVHLLTREAFEIYRRHLHARTGVLAFHISNRSLDLSPVIAGLAYAAGEEAWLVDSMDPENGRSVWVLVGQFDRPLSRDMVRLHPTPEFRIWTDDYSSLFAVLR